MLLGCSVSAGFGGLAKMHAARKWPAAVCLHADPSHTESRSACYSALQADQGGGRGQGQEGCGLGAASGGGGHGRQGRRRAGGLPHCLFLLSRRGMPLGMVRCPWGHCA